MPDTPSSTPGVLLVLRNGRHLVVGGLTATRAKHIRRAKSEFTITQPGGGKLVIRGKDIKSILPVPTPANSDL